MWVKLRLFCVGIHGRDGAVPADTWSLARASTGRYIRILQACRVVPRTASGPAVAAPRAAKSPACIAVFGPCCLSSWGDGSTYRISVSMCNKVLLLHRGIEQLCTPKPWSRYYFHMHVVLPFLFDHPDTTCAGYLPTYAKRANRIEPLHFVHQMHSITHTHLQHRQLPPPTTTRQT